MKQKEKSVEKVKEVAGVLRCPLCKGSLKVIGSKSLVCPNHHTFDFAKQGYVNLMSRSSNSQYDKRLFESRQKIILESNLYTTLHEEVSAFIQAYSGNFSDPTVLLDAGCGEGSHLQRILDESNDHAITSIGLDVSKEGIVMAAKKYKNTIWLVGDLAHSPLVNHSCHFILNILSPANYQEFKRILDPDGFLIKVVPRVNYFKELRDALFGDTDQKGYENNDTVSLFKQHFHLLKHLRINDTHTLGQTALKHLMQMSPLAWNANQQHVDEISSLGLSGVTIDLDILIGSNKQPREV